MLDPAPQLLRCVLPPGMLNHEPAGHTGSFVRRRVSPSSSPTAVKNVLLIFRCRRHAASRSALNRSLTFAALFFVSSSGARAVATRLAAARISRASPKYHSESRASDSTIYTTRTCKGIARMRTTLAPFILFFRSHRSQVLEQFHHGFSFVSSTLSANVKGNFDAFPVSMLLTRVGKTF